MPRDPDDQARAHALAKEQSLTELEQAIGDREQLVGDREKPSRLDVRQELRLPGLEQAFSPPAFYRVHQPEYISPDAPPPSWRDYG